MSAQPAAAPTTTTGTLRGRVVLVTGGNRGIGLGMARGVAAAGADVVVWGRSDDVNARAVEELDSLGTRALGLRCDVGSEREVVEAFARTLAETGRVDAVFANAGMSPPACSFLESTLADLRAVMAVNLEGAAVVFREAARHMVERGEGGSLVGVASIAALGGMNRFAGYAASKAALVGLVKSLAQELGRHRIRANAVLPGWVDTGMTADADDRLREKVTRRTPARRFGVPGDFAGAAAYLADPTYAFHTGDTLILDGGYKLG
jgi:NAD(P)-dependent dehydrogenase (short-subunit alcohol dehydrogenase family)